MKQKVKRRILGMNYRIRQGYEYKIDNSKITRFIAEESKITSIDSEGIRKEISYRMLRDLNLRGKNPALEADSDPATISDANNMKNQELRDTP